MDWGVRVFSIFIAAVRLLVGGITPSDTLTISVKYYPTSLPVQCPMNSYQVLKESL